MTIKQLLEDMIKHGRAAVVSPKWEEYKADAKMRVVCTVKLSLHENDTVDCRLLKQVIRMKIGRMLSDDYAGKSIATLNECDLLEYDINSRRN